MSTQTTIRMRRCGIDGTLHGYIFTDRRHARQWLAPYASEQAGFRLEEVEVGPLMRCPRCGRDGYRQDVRVVRQITFAEALSNG